MYGRNGLIYADMARASTEDLGLRLRVSRRLELKQSSDRTQRSSGSALHEKVQSKHFNLSLNGLVDLNLLQELEAGGQICSLRYVPLVKVF